MSQKTTCDVKRVHLLLYVIHAVTPFWPMYYIILSFLCSCLKKQACHRHLHGFEFWLLTPKVIQRSSLNSENFLVKFAFLSCYGEIDGSLTGLEMCDKTPTESKRFSLYLIDFIDFYLTAIKLRIYSKNSLKIKVRF